jgi:hypothetical protein
VHISHLFISVHHSKAAAQGQKRLPSQQPTTMET